MNLKIFFPVLLAVILSFGIKSHACTNLIVTKGASSNNSNMVSYAADSHTRYGCIQFLPAALHQEGDMRKINVWGTNRPLNPIPEVMQTYNVVGNMNEYQVVMGESTWGGKEEMANADGVGIDYGSLMYISMQRAKTAREAIEIFVTLANKYGYASNGESISIADSNEAWFMDVIGKCGAKGDKGILFVAIRIPDGCISAHANQARIMQFDMHDPENCIYSPDIVDYARKMGYFSGKDEDFSFAEAFDTYDGCKARSCDARVWSFFNKYGAEDMSPYLDYALGHGESSKRLPLYVKAHTKLGVKEVALMMRDHFEGTPMDMTQDIGAGGNECPYRWRPASFEVDGKTYINERAIATQQTGFWFIGQCNASAKINRLGGIIWFGVDDSGTSPLTPVFTCSTEISKHYALGQNSSMLQYSDNSMFWLCNRIAQFAYLRYNHIGAEVRSIIDNYENDKIKETQLVSQIAQTIGETNFDAAVSYLTNYSVDSAHTLFCKWRTLNDYLLVKYMDGNIKKQDEQGNFVHQAYSDSIPVAPQYGGYSKKWKEAVVRDAGERLLAPDNK